MEDIDIWQLRFDSCFYSEKLLNKISLKNQNQNDQSVDIHEVKKAIYYAKNIMDHKKENQENRIILIL